MYRLLMPFAFCLAAAPAMAQGLTPGHAYFGLGLAVSRQEVNMSAEPERPARVGSTYDVEDRQTNLTGYLGYRRGAWGLEAGGGHLGLRTAHNVQDGQFDITQEISTRYVYLQALRFFDVASRLSLQVHAGAARVWMKNLEYGCNDACPDYVEQVNYSVATRPIVGLGLRLRLTDSVALRLDASRINNVAVSLWTRSSEVTLAVAALESRF